MNARQILLVWVVLLGGALVLAGVPASAEVTVKGTVVKTKDKTVTETIDIQKTVTINETADIEVKAAAESQIVKNQDINGEVTNGPKSAAGDGSSTSDVEDNNSTATIGEAGDPNAAAVVGADGVAQFNQSPGSLNNQANEASITAAQITADTGSGTMAHSEVAVQQVIQNSHVFSGESGQPVGDIPENSTTIIGEETLGLDGLTQVNQGAGDLNNQNNSIGMAVAGPEPVEPTGTANPYAGTGVLALGEVDLGQTTANSTAVVHETRRTDTIADGALDGAAGVAQLNQASGYLNNQANIWNAAVIAGTAGATTP